MKNAKSMALGAAIAFVFVIGAGVIGSLFVPTASALSETRFSTLRTPNNPHPALPPASGMQFKPIVLCSNCDLPGQSGSPHIMILDEDSGDVWAYKRLNETGIYMGRFSRLGMPLQKSVQVDGRLKPMPIE